MLEPHADTERPRRRWRGDLDFRAPPEDLAGVGLQRAVQHLHERRLAGAVLAEQGMNLALADRDADAVIGDKRAEALDDATCLQDAGWLVASRRRGQLSHWR